MLISCQCFKEATEGAAVAASGLQRAEATATGAKKVAAMETVETAEEERPEAKAALEKAGLKDAGAAHREAQRQVYRPLCRCITGSG